MTALPQEEIVSILSGLEKGTKILLDGVDEKGKPFKKTGYFYNDDGDFFITEGKRFALLPNPREQYHKIEALRAQSIPPKRKTRMIEQALAADGDDATPVPAPPAAANERLGRTRSQTRAAKDAQADRREPPQSVDDDATDDVDAANLTERLLRATQASDRPAGISQAEWDNYKEFKATQDVARPAGVSQAEWDSYKEFKRTRSQSAPDDDLAADRRLSHILRSAVAGEVKNSYQLCDELEMIQACDEAFKVFSVVHLVKGRKSVSEWTADFSQALVELMSTATPGPRQNNAQNKPATQLTLDAQMIHQRFATRVFKATLMRCLKQGLPQNKEDYFEVVYAGVNLMQIVATKFHHHYLSSGALVLSKFAEQWKKGIVDIEALWPRGKKFRDH